MKKLLLVLSALAGTAQAQVTIYGVLDTGLIKKNGASIVEGRGDNNLLGFKGVEDLGGGMSAIFQLETRFEPDTGSFENGTRPFLQGQSRVGLSGAFGTIRLGRALTVAQETVGRFDTFTGNRTVGSMFNYQVAGFNSDPYVAGSSANRIGNAVFYHSPTFSGFQANAQIASKEGMGSSPDTLPSNPYSLAFAYTGAAFAAAIGVERNPREDKLLTLSGSYDFGVVKVLSTIARTNPAFGASAKSWQLAGDIPVGPGSFKVAYGQIKADGADTDKKYAMGYWHNLSKRTYLYTDIARNTVGTSNLSSTKSSNTQFDIGIHHSF